jgi:hypothetical protein
VPTQERARTRVSLTLPLGKRGYRPEVVEALARRTPIVVTEGTDKAGVEG